MSFNILIQKFEGPKAGYQLIGPIDDNRTDLHACYSDFIIAGFMKGRLLPLRGSNVSSEEGIEEWKTLYPHSCRTTCPGRSASEGADGLASQVSAAPSPIPSPVPITNPLPGLRHSPRLAVSTSVPLPAGSSTLSPLFDGLDLENPHFLPTNPPGSPTPFQASSGPTIVRLASQPTEVFVMPDRPTIHNSTSYVSPNDVPFQNLRRFADHMAEHHTSFASGDSGSMFVSGSSVSEAAQALVLAIKGTGPAKIHCLNRSLFGDVGIICFHSVIYFSIHRGSLMRKF